ncbi:MAG: hypothetical protein J6037_05355 [Bacteroidales bacterium]|nr:hypothetical protein [Bacteroidales bacterium]
MKRSFKLSDIGQLLKNSVKAIFEGEFLLRLKIGRYFVNIVLVFVIITFTIWISLLIDNTMTKVERGKAVIAEQEATIARRTYELSSLTRRSGAEKHLEELGSTLKEAEKPPIVLK